MFQLGRRSSESLSEAVAEELRLKAQELRPGGGMFVGGLGFWGIGLRGLEGFGVEGFFCVLGFGV